MKICNKCGAYNKDDKLFCVDCNEKLGEKLSEREESAIEQSISEKADDLYNAKDPLYVGWFDKASAVASMAGILCSIVLIIIDIFTAWNFDYLFFGILFFILAIVEALVPQISWELEKWRLSFYLRDADSAEPNDFYLTSRRIGIVIFAAVGIAVLIMNLLKFRQ